MTRRFLAPLMKLKAKPLPAKKLNYTPGSILWVRVRTVGLGGVMGGWSDPAQIRVL